MSPRPAFLSVLVLAACGGPHADLVLRGALVQTMDERRPTAEAVAIHHGRIVYVGPEAGVAAWIGPATRILDLPGRLILPGFHDTHVHTVTGGMRLALCDLADADSRDALARLVARCAAAAGDRPWVTGGGWQLPLFPDGNAPARLLDSLIPDRPVYLRSADGHSAWVNSRALALAGVTAATADPPGGRIERDRNRAPSGTLRETAMGLVARHVPPPTEEELLRGLERGLAMAARLGITTLHEASADEPILRAYAAADSLGLLTARVIVSLRVDTDQGPEQVARLAELRRRYAGGRVDPAAAKIFLDGVIEGGTAALLEPYLDRPGYRGELYAAPDHLEALVGALAAEGFKVHIHAIGDRAIRVAFDAFAAQRARDGGRGRRHLMAHIQLFDPADIPRFAELGVVASFQPLWAYEDSYIRDLTVPRLGPERSRWLYPIRSVVETGAIVAGGSDWAVTSMDPLEAIQVAVTRRALDDSTGPAWLPDERIALATALRLYTLGGALAGDLERTTGSIEVGKAADLVVLSENLFALPAHRIRYARPMLTLLEGRVVYEDPLLAARSTPTASASRTPPP
jgi:predicted amidohydrolase YtcJ